MKYEIHSKRKTHADEKGWTHDEAIIEMEEIKKEVLKGKTKYTKVEVERSISGDWIVKAYYGEETRDYDKER